MLATKSPTRTGSPEEHANIAWAEAAACSEAEGLNRLRETSLPYKVSSYGRLTRGPHNKHNGTTRKMDNEGFILRNGTAAE
eukprot:3991161-Heterocapsa_arctica.AAC.1